MRKHDTANRPAMQGHMRTESADGEMTPIRVLVVDDDTTFRRSVERILKSLGFEVTTASDGVRSLKLLAVSPVDVLLLDLVMPGMNGLDVLRKVKALNSAAEVVLMTAHGDVDSAVAALKAGAHDFLTKPLGSPDALAHVVVRAAQHSRLVARARRLEKELEVRERYGDIIGSSASMRFVFRAVESVAHSKSTVLLLGEPGTGKELVARSIHMNGRRAKGPFVPVNCSAIPKDLIEVELFGHVRGAFPDASESRTGHFEAADGGTIFLDEIDHLTLETQVKLHRILQDGEIKREGSNDANRMNVRIIAATDVDLKKAMEQGQFREDLFYRLSVITIPLPPLRDRAEDMPLLAYHFLRKYSLRSGRKITRISLEAMRVLRSHTWPGNVRELENAIERSVVMARGDVILPGDLPPSVVDTAAPLVLSNPLLDLPFSEAKSKAVEQFESSYVHEMLKRAGGNVSEAARQSRMDRSNFRRIIRKHKIRT